MKYTISLILLSLLACKTKKTTTATTDFQLDQIEINLVDTMDPKRLEGSFSTLNLSLLCVKNKSENICIYRFDPKKKNLMGMLDLLDGEVGVQSVRKTKGCKGQ